MGRKDCPENTMGHPGLWYVVLLAGPQGTHMPSDLSRWDHSVKEAETPVPKGHPLWRNSVGIELSEKDVFKEGTKRPSQVG